MSKTLGSREIVDQAANSAVHKAKNSLMPSISSWPHELWFSTHTGYERSEGGRRKTRGNENTWSPIAQSGSRKLRHREVSRQIHTDAHSAGPQLNTGTKGEFVGRMVRAILCH